jgi:hypothetical protein
MMGIKDRQFAPLPDLSLEELVPGIIRSSLERGDELPDEREVDLRLQATVRVIPGKMYDRQSANVSLPGAGSRGGGKG